MTHLQIQQISIFVSRFSPGPIGIHVPDASIAASQSIPLCTIWFVQRMLEHLYFIWSLPHMVTISWSFIAHAENAEATLVSAARWPRSPTQGHLSLHFAYFFFLLTKPILVVRGLICLSSILPAADRDGVLERPR